MFCTACGTQAQPGARFCGECGGPIAPASASPQTRAPLSIPTLTQEVDREAQAAQPSNELPAWPWARFLARQIDLSLEFAALTTLLYFAAPQILIWIGERTGNPWGIVFIFLPAVMLLDALILAIFGTTPGKWLARIKVRREGRRPNLLEAIWRNSGVYFAGFALGIPLVGLITIALSARRLRLKRRTSWDDWGDFTVTGPRLSVVHWMGLVTLWIVLWFAGTVAGTIGGTVVMNQAQSIEPVTAVAKVAPIAPKVAKTPPLTWKNPITGRSLTFPEGWRTIPSGVEGLHAFIDAPGQNIVMIGTERLDFDPPKSTTELLLRYMDALEKANAGWGKGSSTEISTDGIVSVKETFLDARMNGVATELDVWVWVAQKRNIWRLIYMREPNTKAPWVRYVAAEVMGTGLP
jgi:uncharacterized RDD family membrane protein YckC